MSDVWAEDLFQRGMGVIIVNYSGFQCGVSWSKGCFRGVSTQTNIRFWSRQLHVTCTKWLLCFCLDFICCLEQMWRMESNRKSKFSKVYHQTMRYLVLHDNQMSSCWKSLLFPSTLQWPISIFNFIHFRELFFVIITGGWNGRLSSLEKQQKWPFALNA